jgi:hypothetical protein
MKNLIRSIILLGVFFNCTFLLYSQDINPVGKYQLRHNIPKEAFSYSDSVIEYPIWIHEEFIELKRNKSVYITVVNSDKSEQKIKGTWCLKDGNIEVKSSLGNFKFVLVTIDKKPHLNSIENRFKYYIKI